MRVYVRRSPEERFWEKVDKSGDCWLWTGYRMPNGYGHFGRGGRAGMMLAHRFAWEISHGPIPEGMVIRHTCDIRHCVRHLEIGTQDENVADMMARGRYKNAPYKRVEPMGKPTLAELFWAKVEKSEGCWLWRGTVTAKGYGQVRVNNRLRSAHRVAWELEHGEIPDGLHVLHECDVRNCVRHIYLGTNAQNVADKVARGRTTKGRSAPIPAIQGIRHPRAKVTEEQVREIRERRQKGEWLKYLAAEFGLSTRQISGIARRETWQHLE